MVDSHSDSDELKSSGGSDRSPVVTGEVIASYPRSKGNDGPPWPSGPPETKDGDQSDPLGDCKVCVAGAGVPVASFT